MHSVNTSRVGSKSSSKANRSAEVHGPFLPPTQQTHGPVVKSKPGTSTQDPAVSSETFQKNGTVHPTSLWKLDVEAILLIMPIGLVHNVCRSMSSHHSSHHSPLPAGHAASLPQQVRVLWEELLQLTVLKPTRFAHRGLKDRSSNWLAPEKRLSLATLDTSRSNLSVKFGSETETFRSKRWVKT